MSSTTAAVLVVALHEQQCPVCMWWLLADVVPAGYHHFEQLAAPLLPALLSV